MQLGNHPVFDSETIRIVSISDTHNEDPSSSIPPGDVFIHAGDMTDFGSLAELEAAYRWIVALPHTIKVVVAGNHDFGLDKRHKDFDRNAVELFTSSAAQAAGIRYLNHEVQTIGYYQTGRAQPEPIKVYGNPSQPEFLGKEYSFIYKPYPSHEAIEAWRDAPSGSAGIHIWAMHSPPFHRLDDINDVYKKQGLTGCKVQAEAIAKAKPLLALFGHYHFSWGIEMVTWNSNSSQSNTIKETKLLTASKERRMERNWAQPLEKSDWNFSAGEAGVIEPGQQTLFVNAAWKVMDKTSNDRNMPFAITLKLPSL